MAYQVLALRWRPKNLSEVIGQNHIVKSLQNALSLNRFAQAYLFTGTRGVGKTSIARIFAKSLRCLNRLPSSHACGECATCLTFNIDSSLDIFEMDGASYNSVDNIREIIANAQYGPSVGDKKIYIIDEVHMLSTSAFNALLKTLEEPPSHVVFIFATTEPHKVPDTVISRCQRFDFKNASQKDLEELICKIALKEKIRFTSPEIIKNLCKLAEGSMRDALSYLEQVVGYSYSKGQSEIEITLEQMSEALGLARSQDLEELLAHILAEDCNQTHLKYQYFLAQNISPHLVLQGLIEIIGEKLKLMTLEKQIPKEFVSFQTTTAEIFWIYEVLAKDYTWATQNNFSFQVIDLLLQKICLRKTFENRTASVPVISVAKEVEAVQVPALPATFSATTEATIPTWDDFLKYLYKKAPASASYLEQGNILSPIEENQGVLAIKIGFPETSKIFFEYMGDKETTQRLKKNLSDFFKKNENEIALEIKLVLDGPLVSKFQIEEKKIEEGRNVRQEQFLNDPMVKMAQDLFQAKVDKVILNQNLE